MNHAKAIEAAARVRWARSAYAIRTKITWENVERETRAMLIDEMAEDVAVFLLACEASEGMAMLMRELYFSGDIESTVWSRVARKCAEEIKL